MHAVVANRRSSPMLVMLAALNIVLTSVLGCASTEKPSGALEKTTGDTDAEQPLSQVCICVEESQSMVYHHNHDSLFGILLSGYNREEVLGWGCLSVTGQ